MESKKVTIVTVLNPNRVVVKEILTEDVEAMYRELADELKLAWESRFKFTDEEKPFPGMHVMVRRKNWSGIFRAIVKDALPNKDNIEYSIFDYDNGIIDLAEPVNLAPLPVNHKLRLRGRAHIVNIAGIGPARLYTDLNDMIAGCSAKPKYVAGGEWSPAAAKYVKNWVEGKELVTVVYKLFDNGEMLGDVFHHDENGVKSQALSAALVNENFAVFSKEKAEQQISYQPTDFRNQPTFKQEQQLDSKIAEGENKQVTDTLKYDELSKSFQQNLTQISHSLGNSKKCTSEEETDEKRKPKRYTTFTPIQEVDSSLITATSSSRITKLSERKGYACCEIPTGRSKINITDVPGRTLVRGLDVYPPLQSYRKFESFTHIQKAWKALGLEEGNELQKCVWPNFVHNHDIFVFGGAKNGKSLSYLAPICADLLSDSTSLRKKQGWGPFAIILCATASSGIKLEGHGHIFLTSNNINQMNCVFADENNEDSNKLRKGTEILITTVDMLVSSQEKMKSNFDFDRLRYLVFDDAHIIFQENFDKAVKLLREFRDYVVKQNPRAQLIVCGNDWTPEVEQFYWKLKDRPIVHIGSPYQAVVYSGVELVVHYVPQKTALMRVSDILKTETDHKKSVVVCVSPETATMLHQQLQNKFKIYAHLVADIVPDNVNPVTLLWDNASDEGSQSQVLVCTDESLKFIKITDATQLIHYEIEDSEKNKNRLTVFGSRFSCMWSNLRDIVSEREAVPWNMRGASGKKLKSHIFLSGKEHDLDKIIKYFRKLDVDIPVLLERYADQILSSKLEKSDICMGTKMFGWCSNTKLSNCDKRHYIIRSETDKEPTLPRSGQVELRVISCTNPSLYNCEIVRYYEMTGKKVIISYTGKLKEYEKLLEKHYADMDNKIPPDSFKTGTFCGLMSPDQGLVRGRILEILTRTSTNFPASVRIFCIDIGEKVIRNVYEGVFKLPTHISDLKPLCVEVILCGLKPPNNAKEYTDKQIRIARDLTEAKIYLGKIICSVENTVWINPLVETVKGKDGKMEPDHSVRHGMVERNLAEINSDHEQKLTKLCENAGYLLDQSIFHSENEFTVTYFQKDDQYYWAHLPVSPKTTFEEHLVSITFVKNPWLVYGNISKYVNILDDLIREINEEVNSLINTTHSKYYEEFATFYDVGLVVLAKHPSDDKWHRVIITSKEVDNVEMYYNVFYVDYGDTLSYVSTSDLFPIKKKFVDRLPFQAIAFNASHIVPRNESSDDGPWAEEIIDCLYEILIPDGIATDANVVILSKDPTSESEEILSRYYCAMIFPHVDPSSTVGKAGDEVGELLAEKGLAEFTKLGKKNLETVKSALLEKYNVIINEKEALDFEDSESDNEYLPPVAGSAKTDNQSYPAGYFDDEGFEVYIPDVANTLSKLGIDPTIISSSTSATNSNQLELGSSSTGEISKIEKQSLVVLPKTFSSSEEPGLKHPNTKWSQTDDGIQLIVELPDITEYTFKVGSNCRTLSFRTIKPPGYGFDIETFGSVTNPKEFLTGQYLRVKLEKRMVGVEWQGFHKKYDVKLPWLKEKLTLDLEKEDDSDDERKNALIPVDYEQMFQDSETSSDDDIDLEDIDDDDFQRADVGDLSRNSYLSK